MGTQNKEIKIALDIQAKIDKASNQINTLKKQIDNFELSKGLAGDFSKEFKNIEHELAELQRKTASGEINLIDAKSAEKEIDKIEKRWAFLLNKIGGDGFLEKGLKTDVQAMSALESLAKSYANEIKEAETQEARLNKKLDEAKQKQKELVEIQKEQKVVKASELEDQKAQLALLRQEEKTAKKTRDDAEKALRAKVEESGGKYSMEQASQKGSPLRKTDAYRTFRDASTAYETAKTNTRIQQTNVGSMVTQEMQVAEAAAAKEAIDKATEALENYRKTSLVTAKEDAFEKAKESLKSIAEFKDIDWNGLDIDMSEIKSVEDLEKAFAKLRIEADKRTNDAIKKMEASTKEAGQGFKAMEDDIKGAKESLEGMDEQARQTEAFEARIKQFLGMAGAVQLLRRALRQAFETTKELDAAMTEMAVVTDLEVGDYWKQLPDHTKRASELGVAIHSVYEAETLYYQQGLKTAEAQELANTTLRMARIAGLDAAEATDKMTAALRGFNMELNEASAEKVADVYSELAAITAADVNEISSAMTKTASIASSAGMEFETTAAFLSQIIETTRESAETAGTAMKTVIARFSEVKKLQGEGLLTGSDEEGEVIDVNKIQTALRSVGISMDEFFAGTEGLDSIFLKLAEKWDTLDVKTQRYIATTAAGSRQQSRFIAMMSDYARTQELVTAANDSAGASQRQYEKTLESLESKLAKLKNAWDEFSMGILQSDLVKFGVDALTMFLEIINKATSAFSGLGGSITKVLATIMLFKLGQKIFDKVKQPFINFLSDLKQTAYTEGEKIGEKIAEGIQKGMGTLEQKAEDAKPTEQTDDKKIKEKSSDIDKFKSSVGISDFQKAQQARKEIDLKTGVTKKKENAARAKENLQKVKKDPKASQKDKFKAEDSYKRAQKNLKEAEKQKKEYIKSDEALQQKSSEAWQATAAGIQKAGMAVAAVGVGVSMLGGFFEQLGLEGVGKVFSKFGNILTLVGGAVSAIGTALMAIPPILTVITAHPIIAIITAVAAVVIGLIVAIASFVKNNSLDARMEKAAEATEKAREQAEAAKKAYDDLLSDRSEYDEMQDKLKNLTKGTKEWKEALRESNAQVLELITTYPELVKHMTRGEDGQLVIKDEGWDALVKAQEKSVMNAQAVLMNKQLNEIELKEEKIKKDRRTSLEKNVTNWNNGGTTDLTNKLEAYNNLAAEDSEERIKAIEEISKKWGMTEEEVRLAAAECQKANDELRAASEEAESIAQATLTTMASEEVTESEYGQQAIDAFANSMSGEVMSKAVKNQTAELKEGKDYRKSEEFDRLATEYGVASDMTGNDDHDLATLYKAVLGVEEIPDEIANDREAMLKAISEADQTNQMIKKMEDYTNKLEEIAQTNKDLADNIASVLSDDGRTMTMDFAQSFMVEGEFDKAKVEQLAKEIYTDDTGEGGKTAVQKYAEAMGKTEDELYAEFEYNVRSAISANESAFKKLNVVIGTSNNKIDKFGDNIRLSTENVVGLSEKIVGAAQIAGQEGGLAIKEGLDNILNAAGDDADKLSEVLRGMNWNEAESWEELPDLLENMGIALPNTKLQEFIELVQDTGIVIDTVNFEKLNEQLTATNELIKSIRSGEQTRVFDQEGYDVLVKANEDIADQFVQIGDEFHYVGTSLLEVANALQKNNVLELSKASYQLDKQLQVAQSLKNFETSGGANMGERNLSLQEGYATWSTYEKRQYLEQFRAQAIKDGVDTLAYITDAQGEALGLSLGMNFDLMSDELVTKALEGLNLLEPKGLEEQFAKAISDQRVASYMLLDTSTLKQETRQARSEEKEQSADEYAKALSIQAAQTGMVSEGIISEYNDLINQNLSEMSETDREAREKRMSELEDVMENAIDRNTRSLEDLQTINSQTQKVANALYSIRQNEIDKLSDINNSINDANQAMIDKLQQQINENRQQRQNKKTEQTISDKQSQLVYLMADSSGVLEAQTLREQILAEQESYQDDLIDQGLQKLSDDNAIAADQRERQIAIMEAQLEHSRESGDLMRQAEAITISSLNAINNGINPLDTEMYNILAMEQEINGNMATSYQQEEFDSTFIKESTEAANARERLETEVEKGTKEDTLDTLNTWLQEELNRQQNEIDAYNTYTKQQGQRDTILSDAMGVIQTYGWRAAKAAGSSANTTYEELKEKYRQAGGDPDTFEYAVKDKMLDSGTKAATNTGVIGTGTFRNYVYGDHNNEDGYKVVNGSAQGVIGSTWYSYIESADDNTQKELNAIFGNQPDQTIVLYQGTPYIYSTQDRGGGWTVNSTEGKRWKKIVQNKDIINQWVPAYKTGGLADFTGPAWLDGTKSRPEMVLNQQDTQNFIQLKNILSDILNDTPTNNNKPSGDNYYSIEITVDEIKDDYDVEQLANKIRSMLVEDANYRNVNAISHIR